MGGPDRFLTLAATPGTSGDYELVVKRSRFLTRLRRVASEEEARAVVEETRREHPAARHHCTAFRLGPTGSLARSSDDGEPAGTAGMPMLQALQGAGVCDVVAVVTRYFGGIKLGTGGLTRAYSDSVSSSLAVCGTQPVIRYQLLEVVVPLTQSGGLEDQLRGLPLPTGSAAVVLGISWGEPTRFEVAVPVASTTAFQEALAGLSQGQLHATLREVVWLDQPTC